MSYNGPKELRFAEFYYHITAEGIVVLDDDTPEEIKKKFWEVWPDFHAKVAALEKEARFSSRYPILPLEDPEENKKHYIKSDE